MPSGRKKRGGGAHGGASGSAAFDGPGDTRGPESASRDGRGRAPSNAGASQSGRSGSQTRPGSQTRSGSQQRGQARGQAAGYHAPEGKIDPAKPVKKTDKELRILSKNIDFGGGAYGIYDEMPTRMMQRPGFGKLGKATLLNINSHIVTKSPTKDIYQYDVHVGSGDEKRGLIQLAIQSKKFKDSVGPGFIFDGNKIGWSMINHPRELRILVDFDAEKGKPPRIGRDGTVRENNTRVRVTKAKNEKVRLAALTAYLEGTADFDTSVLEAINFLDHLLRETPSKKHINLRRSYFARAPDRNDTYLVGGGVEAMKGVYQSLRTAEGKKLIVNVDVSNSCFWNQTSFSQLAYQISGEADRTKFNSMAMMKDGREPPLWKALKRLVKNKFIVRHGGQTQESKDKIHTMMRLCPKNAKTYTFPVRNRDTGDEKTMSLFDYFGEKYNIRIENHHLPLVEAQKGTMFPMELCYMCAGQRFPYKLNEIQTAAMIKFAVSQPPKRKAAIDHGLNMLGWSADPMLRNYGMNISPTMLETKARVLDPPEVQYAKNALVRPMYSGRWNLQGKVFFKPNEAVLKSWGVVIISSSQDRRPLVTQEQTKAFLKSFISLYIGHGGRVDNKTPPIIQGVPDAGKALETVWTAAGNYAQLRPQMLMVILPNKSAEVYQRVKKSCDCRFGVMSQCIQAINVVKNQPQYCSNVLMKFNCKLGGTTCIIKAQKPFFEVPTMIIGADVSHAAPGAQHASMAAMCVSMDLTASRFAAAVETNGYRVEMIQTNTLEALLKPLIQRWMNTVSEGRLPKHVYYFRDGVSEGQYAPLLKAEVADIKRVFEDIGGKPETVPAFTVVVCEKRHHIRFFPKTGFAADKNMNPVPGTLVERDVTHPFENDIYLCSHAAIQGTARPTHYHMLMDEANVHIDKFQAMLYQHCYQYQRATTPVSLYPAVYYAHLAAARGIAHINKSEEDKWIERRAMRANSGQAPADSAEKSEAEAPRLLPIEPTNGIQWGMWYI